MTKEQLREKFEQTGGASWINSDIYPDGRIYTKAYTEWLEQEIEKRHHQITSLTEIIRNLV